MICALFANYFSACHCDPTSETIESLDNKEVCTNSSKGMSTTTTTKTKRHIEFIGNSIYYVLCVYLKVTVDVCGKL